MPLRPLVLKLHIYAALLTFTQLVVYGIAGLAATFQSGPALPSVPQAVRYVTFDVPASATDKQVADQVYKTLALPLTRPLSTRIFPRTSENDLRLDFYNINGIWRVIVLEREHRLRIEEIHKRTVAFLGDVHANARQDAETPRVIRLWSLYNAFAMWCLIGFCVSGIYLWLSADARPWWAWASLAAGTGAFTVLWMAFR